MRHIGHSARVLSLRSKTVRAACAGVVLAALAVSACGDDGDSGAVVQSPDLECGGERSGTFNPDFDPASPGEATSDIATEAVVQPFAASHNGQVVVLRSDTKAVEVDGKRARRRRPPSSRRWVLGRFGVLLRAVLRNGSGDTSDRS